MTTGQGLPVGRRNNWQEGLGEGNVRNYRRLHNNEIAIPI
jgi:hypothetical protein